METTQKSTEKAQGSINMAREGEDCGSELIAPRIDAIALDAYSRIKLADSIDSFTKQLKQLDFLRIDCGALFQEAILANQRINDRSK